MTVELCFDAQKYDPWRGAPHELPASYASYLWHKYYLDDEQMDFETACSLAPYDLEVFTALQEWAWSVDTSSLPQEIQIALCIALVRKPPRKGVGEIAKRNARLRAIAGNLVREYGLPLAQAVAGGSTPCAAGILATLPGTPVKKTIANILTLKNQV